MSEAELILPNMRGGCVRVGGKVHTLFRLTSARRSQAAPEQGVTHAAIAAPLAASATAPAERHEPPTSR